MIGSKVLVVDDDPQLVTLVSSWLRKEGLQTCSASDGASCLMQARRERPDLIVLDLGLPAGDGMVALERLKKNMHTAEVPVLVLSANSAEQSAEKALAAGARAYCEKTGSRADFIASVRSVLESTTSADSFE